MVWCKMMKMGKNTVAEVSARIETEANEWFLRIQNGDLDEQGLAAWRRWMEKDTAHEKALQRVETLWQSLNDLGDIPLPSEAELAADNYEGDQPVLQWQQQQPQENPVPAASSLLAQWLNNLKLALSPTQNPWPAATFASALIVGLVLILSHTPPTPAVKVNHYQTAHAEHRIITLQDGSVVELAAESILIASFADNNRNVNLISGEAYFKVASDKTRPFTVQMGSGFVQVVGTAFNIDRDDQASTVTVLEGLVRVAQHRSTLDKYSGVELQTDQSIAQLGSGDQVTVEDNGSLSTVHKVDAESAIAWREGLLAFVNQPMREVIEELNRYSSRRIILANVAVGEINYTGTVDKTKIDEWLQGLVKAFPVNLSIIGDDTVLLSDKAL